MIVNDSASPDDRRARHVIVAGALAALSYLLVLALVVQADDATLRRDPRQVAGPLFDEKWRGVATQHVLLADTTIVPMYGSSELVVDMPNRAPEFFASHANGFTLAPIGDRGYPPLSMAIALASLGSAARNHHIILSLSGTWFLGDDTLQDVDRFRAHYSQLQMGDAIFFGRLPLEVAQPLAARVREYVPSDSGFPMLNAALRCLEVRCPVARYLPFAAPLWMLRSLELRAYDYRDAARHRAPVHPQSNSAPLNWQALERQGDSAWRQRVTTNPYGIQDSIWQVKDHWLSRRGHELTDSVFLARMRGAERWKDLDLLFAIDSAIGARTLVLNTPLKGAYWDYLGVSERARQQYYARVNAIASRHTQPVHTFAERDSDVFFLSENRSHLSDKGWAVYDRTINAFVHDSIH